MIKSCDLIAMRLFIVDTVVCFSKQIKWNAYHAFHCNSWYKYIYIYIHLFVFGLKTTVENDIGLIGYCKSFCFDLGDFPLGGHVLCQADTFLHMKHAHLLKHENFIF